MPISGIRPDHIDTEIIVRGIVTRTIFAGYEVTKTREPMGVRLQEISTENAGTMPRSLECFCDAPITDPTGNCAEIRGTLTALRGKSREVSRVVLQKCQITPISREDAVMEELMKLATWFTQENLEATKGFRSQMDLVTYLNEKANSEGFQLVRKYSEKENHNMLRCHQHSHYNKLKDLNEDCEFLIRIRRCNKDNTWYVTSFDLQHNHFMDPSVYAHLVLDARTKGLIRDLYLTNVQMPQILSLIKCETGLQLSSQQVRSLCKKAETERHVSETDALKEMMEKDGGSCYTLETAVDDTIYRIACGAFTQEELQNLSQYGDFVSIDPTFAPLTSEWNIIPLTLIGKNRQLLSGGLIFASNTKAETFIWILQLLLEVLPTKDKLKTLCSDDDSGLGSAFAKVTHTEHGVLGISVELKRRVSTLRRVICYWHKLENFRNFMVRAKVDKEGRQLYESYFKLMAFTRSEEIHRWALNKLKNIDATRPYIVQIEDKLANFCKAQMGDMFNCGYITSSGSESANNRLKSHMSGRALSLCEIRSLQTDITQQANAFARYLTGRKHRKVVAAELVEIMTLTNVSQNIATRILYSKQKAERFNVTRRGPNFIMEQTIEVEDGTTLIEKHTVSRTKCTCRKFEQTGLPCSHVLRTLMEQGIELSTEHVHPRWRLDHEIQEINFDRSELEGVGTAFESVPTSNSETDLSPQGRYMMLVAQTRSLIAIASRSKQAFVRLSERLSELEAELQDENHLNPTEIVDAHATRPGRKRMRRTPSHA